MPSWHWDAAFLHLLTYRYAPRMCLARGLSYLRRIVDLYVAPQ